VIETHLNLKGGVTEGAVREFVQTFVEEVDQFQTLIRDSDPRKNVAKKENIFKEVPAEKLEKILEEMKSSTPRPRRAKGPSPINTRPARPKSF